MDPKREKTTLCFVIKDNQLLLLERQNTWFENEKYLPPGGLVDDGESPEVSAARETFEESGIVVNPASLKLIYDYSSESNGRTFHSYHFLAHECSGELLNKEPHRHSDAGWFDLDNLPSNTSDLVHQTLQSYEQSR